MAKFCTNCGAPITETTKFCTNCGKPLSVEPAPQTAATPPPQNAEQTVKSTPEQSVRAKPKPAGKTALGPGAAICGAMLCVTCLPYVLKSLLFLSRRDFLDGMLLLALELLGMAAAAVVLLPGSKRAVGRMQVSAALLLAVLVPGVHAADELLIQQLSLLTPRENLIYAAGLLAVRLIAAGLAGSALRALFVPQTGTKQGGKISAIVCSLAALFAPDLVTLAWSYSPYEDVISFFSTVSCKALAAFVASCGFTAATNCMLRRRPSGQGQPKKSGLLTLGSGIVLAVLSVAAALQGMASRSVAVIAAEDVGGSLSDAELLLAMGDMGGALECYGSAAAHCEAWTTAASGEAYELPEGYESDSTLVYLSYVNRDADALRSYLVTELDEEEIDIWCPLMIDKYRKKMKQAELSEQETAHYDEMLRLCVAQECFTMDCPTAEDLKAEGKNLEAHLKLQETLYAKIELVEEIDRIQRGNVELSDGVNRLLDVAERYPEELVFQYIAGAIGSENRWDGAGHYGRSADALERYRSLWLAEYGKEASREDLSKLDGALAGMMINMGSYDRAIPLLESALEQDRENSDLQQQLAFCYNSTGNTEAGYNLNKALYAAAADDVNVLWSYCVGALKHGEGAEAVQAASRFANLVRTKLGKNANGEDEMLFNLVLYLALDDSSWTDYHYRIYNGADTVPELLAEFEKDAFLHNYVQAAYWEKQCQDPQKALPFAQAALSMQEQSGRLWYLNAIIYYDSGVFDKALECYKRADALEPDDPSILFGLANTYDALEDYKTAYQYCERALAHYPSGVDHSYDNYGVSYHARDLLNRLRPYVEVDES